MQYASASLDLASRRSRAEPFLAYTLGWPCLLRHWTHTSGRAGQARDGIFGILFGGLFEIQGRRVEPRVVAGLGFKRVGYVNQVQAAPIVIRLRPVEVTLCVVWIERDSRL